MASCAIRLYSHDTCLERGSPSPTHGCATHCSWLARRRRRSFACRYYESHEKEGLSLGSGTIRPCSKPDEGVGCPNCSRPKAAAAQHRLEGHLTGYVDSGWHRFQQSGYAHSHTIATCRSNRTKQGAPCTGLGSNAAPLLQKTGCLTAHHAALIILLSLQLHL
jgi:hypothetical protein